MLLGCCLGLFCIPYGACWQPTGNLSLGVVFAAKRGLAACFVSLHFAGALVYPGGDDLAAANEAGSGAAVP